MNHLKHYCNLIRKAENRNSPEGYVEKHHIFPVSIYGKNDKIVILTGREHYIAHALLEKAFIKRYGLDHSKTYKMSSAHYLMKDGTRYYNSYLYECARERWSKMHSQKMKGNIPWNKGKRGSQIPWNKGMKTGSFAERTEEWNKKIGDANRGRKMSDEQREKMRGRKVSEETKRKLSEINKGKTLSEETKEKIRKAGMGRKLSEEHKRKLYESRIGKETPKEVREKISKSLKGNKLSEETRKKISAALIGGKYWNNGQITKRSPECPGIGWERGRCKKAS